MIIMDFSRDVDDVDYTWTAIGLLEWVRGECIRHGGGRNIRLVFKKNDLAMLFLLSYNGPYIPVISEKVAV